jgi:pyridoxine kinase
MGGNRSRSRRGEALYKAGSPAEESVSRSGNPFEMNILSVQSHVSFGHVGNAAAVFPLQRLGVEVWPVNTVEFSNHPGYGSFKGTVFSAQFVSDMLAGIEQRGVLSRCDGILSGYLGDAAIGAAMLGMVERGRKANAKLLYCCDPVIGDTDEGIYVRPGVPEFMRERAVPAADILTPNHFELEWLNGAPCRDRDALRQALRNLSATGPSVILVTSLHLGETPPDAIDLAVHAKGQSWLMRTPRLPIAPHGSGDAIAALFFHHYLRKGDAAAALGQAGASVFGLLQRTAEAGSREILLIEAQDEFVKPSRTFPVETL